MSLKVISPGPASSPGPCPEGAQPAPRFWGMPSQTLGFGVCLEIATADGSGKPSPEPLRETIEPRWTLNVGCFGVLPGKPASQGGWVKGAAPGWATAQFLNIKIDSLPLH